MVRIVSFNVNGIRSFERSLLAQGASLKSFLDSLVADVICFQETKVNLAEAAALDGASITHPPGYASLYSYNSSKRTPGYSGVATYWKCSAEPARLAQDWRPTFHQCGFTGYSSGNLLACYSELSSGTLLSVCHSSEAKISLRQLDSEGRCLITDHVAFILMNIYFPLGSSASRTAFKLAYQSAIGLVIKLFSTVYGRSVVVAGDINATYDPRDHCEYAGAFRHNDPKHPLAVEFYGGSNRAWFRDIVCTTLPAVCAPESTSLLVDTLRFCEPDCEARYTCWNARIGARTLNYGTRIDYILIDKLTVRRWYEASQPTCAEGLQSDYPFECTIQSSVFGSDHCPVVCTFEDSLFELSSAFGHSTEHPTFVAKRKSPTRLEQYFTPAQRVREIGSTFTEPSRTHNPQEKRERLEDFFKPDSATKPTSGRSALNKSDQNVLRAPEPSQSTGSGGLSLAWHQVFHGSKKSAPTCMHGEPCTLLIVNKKGLNQGRKFYLCSRPIGSSEDPTARCNFFQWAR